MTIFKDVEERYINIRIDVEDFEEKIKEWFKKEKGIDLTLKTSWEGADDYGALGSYYFGIDESKISKDFLTYLKESYGDYISINKILEEIYKKEVTLDFEPGEEIVYLYIKE